MRRIALAALAAATVGMVGAVTALASDSHDTESATAVTYAVIGDTPYGQPQIDNFPNDVAEINADPKVRLVMHLGDIKNGSSVCSTDYFNQIRSDFDQFKDPLVYTPGDNEWTDCHRSNNGAYWPAGPVLNGDSRPARLDEIRRIFFDQPGRTLGAHSEKVAAQTPNYPENVRWFTSRVQFGDLNVPGSNNDWMDWFDPTPTSNPADDPPRSQSQIDEVTQRTAADVSWLDGIFDAAEANEAKAVVIGIQADMWDPAIMSDPTQYDHFQAIVQELAQQSLDFGKPVLLLNGDSHRFTDDYPLSASAPAQNRTNYGITAPVPNLHRITVNGSTTPCHEWLKLTIDPSSEGIFSYQRVLFSKQPGFDHTICPES
jgi:hypothetical protein